MLTGFQLKAAIGVLKIKVIDLSKLVNLNRFTIGKLERTPNTKHLNCHTSTLLVLEDFFKLKNLLFLDDSSISLSLDSTLSNPCTQKKLTIFQLRAARAALGLSLVQFSQLTNYSISTLSNLEQGSILDFVQSNFVDSEILRQIFIKNSLSFPNDFTVRINE